MATAGLRSNGTCSARAFPEVCSTALAQKIRWPRVRHQSAGEPIDIDGQRPTRRASPARSISRRTLENVAFARKAVRQITRGAVRELLALANGTTITEVHVACVRVRASRTESDLGGPDIVPYKKAQMKNVLSVLPSIQRQVGAWCAMAVQEPTLDSHQPRDQKAVHARRVRGVRGRTTWEWTIIF